MAFSQIVIPLLAWLVIRGLNGTGEIIAFHPVWYDPVWVGALIALLSYSDRIEPMLVRVQRWSYRHYKPVLLIPTLTIPFFFLGIFKLQVLPVFDGDLPEDNVKVRSYREYEEVRGQEHSAVFTISRDTGVVDAETMDLLGKLVDAIAKLPGVTESNILSYRTVRTIVRGEGDDVDIRKLHEIIDMIGDRDGRTARIRELLADHPLAHGRLVDDDGNMAVVQVRYDYSIDRIRLHRGAMRIVERFQSEYPDYTFGVVGFDILEQQIMLEIIFMAVVLSTVATIIMVFLLGRSFGVRADGAWHWSRMSGVTFSMGLLTFYPVIWVMGGLGWAGVGIDTVTAVIPIVFIAVASSYGVHMVYHIAQSAVDDEEDRVLEGTRAVLKPLFTSALTTAIGFLTLAPFAVVSIRKFGIYAGFGVALMLMIIYVMGPAWCRFWPIPKRSDSGVETATVRGASWLAYRALKTPGLTAMTLATLMCFAVYEVPRLRVGSNPTEFITPSGIFPRTSRQLTKHFGANGAVFVSYDCGVPDCVLEPDQLQRIDLLAESIRREDGVAFVQSFAEEERYLNERFADGTGLPDSHDLASQLLLAYEMAGERSQFMSDDRRVAFLTIWGDFRESGTVDQLYDGIERYASAHNVRLTVGSEYVLWSAQTDYIVRGKLVSWAQSVLLIVLGGWAVFGTALAGVIISLPLLVATLLLLALMAYLGISLDIATTVITSITIGVGADYGIHTYSAYLSLPETDGHLVERLGQTIRQATAPIIYDAESNVIGFGVFIGSALQPVSHCGYMLIVSMVTASIGALVIVPLAIRLLHREPKLG